MELKYSELDNNILLISLVGRLDIIGTGEIETKFAGYSAGEKACMIVDLSQVDFLSSIGIRLLMLTVKSVLSRGGKTVILRPNPEVQDVLEIACIPAVIPIYSHLESAEAVLMAG